MTEQQEYRVLESRGNVELREYVTCVVAGVVVSGSAEQLAMTAPVIQEPAGTDQWTVSFVLRAVPAETAAAIRWSGRWTDSNVARRNEMVIPVRRPDEGSGG